jgi:hypothetical protein
MIPWKFYNPKDPDAVRQRQVILGQIDHWWQTFRGKTQDLDDLFRRRKEWDLPRWMQDNLQAIHPSLMWEFCANADGHALVITPEGQRQLRPLVDTMLERAPQLPGWKYYPYRQPETPDTVIEAVKAKSGSDLSAVKAFGQIGEQHRIDLSFEIASASGPDDQEALRDAFLATEALLGEEVLDKWVGAIEATPRVTGGRLLPLGRLQETVAALIQSIRDRLPERPYHAVREESSWSLLKLEPEQGPDDFAFKDDLFVATTRDVELWKAMHPGRSSFASERFSRHGERFCFVKIDGSAAEEMTFADRAEIEDAVNEALGPPGLGCSVGGGTGLRYSYVDLALNDLERGLAAVRQALQAGKIPKRTWVQFFDADWQQEWLGIWDDAPAPPM